MAGDSAEINAIVVEYGGKSYIRVRASHHLDGKYVSANGETGLQESPGDRAFLVYDGAPVETLERVYPPKRIRTKYVLREDLRGAEKPEVVSVDQHQNLSENDQLLYTPIYEDLPERREEIPFVIQKENGPPSQLPDGIVCIDNNWFARFPSFRHLGPVRATQRYVLYRVATRLSEIIQDNPFIKWGMLDRSPCEEILKNRHRTGFFIEVGKLEMDGVTYQPDLKRHFTTDREKAQRNGSAQFVGTVDGENLDDLEAKVSAYVEKLVAPARKWVKPNSCPCCKRRFGKKPKRAA